MPTIEVSQRQYERLDALREELAAEFVGDYGTVRCDDAVEYLLDCHAEDDVAPVGEGDGSEEHRDGEDESGTGGEDGESDDDSGESDRLAAMMNLLDEHDEKWREVSADEGNYEVDLPDGGVEVVRTKDDVRAVLFSNY